MGKRAVQVSNQLWQEICTIGWRAGDRSIVECVEGLPEGAVFYSAYFKSNGEQPLHRPILVFVFEHPDWPGHDEYQLGDNLPVIDVTHRSYYDGARRAAQAILAQYIVQDEFEFETVPVDELAKVIQDTLSDYGEGDE